MSGAGRTYWWGKDSAWWRRELIVVLGEEFGADGPAVIDWLSCEAKAQNDGGRVKTGKRSVARGSFVELVTVGHVLSRAVELGVLDDFEEADGRFTCRISGWKADQDRASAAARKRAQRVQGGSTEPDPHADGVGQTVTDRDKSRSVPLQDSTGEDPETECGARAENELAQLVEDVLATLAKAPRLTVDDINTRIGVENAIASAGKGLDVLAAAQEAVVWASDPAWRKTNAAAVFLDALRKQRERGGATVTPLAPRGRRGHVQELNDEIERRNVAARRAQAERIAKADG